MSHNNTKKYYWLKLKDNFFNDPKIKKLRKIAGGDTYTIILQKIMLLSICDGGIIKFQGIEKTLQEELSLILDEDVSNVEIALSFMNSTGLIEPLSDEEFLLPSVPVLIGSEGDSAERMRKLREKKSLQKQLSSHCDALVTKSDTEKEIELEKDLMGDDAREEYLLFRMAGEGIENPIALRKTILSALKNPDSDESKDFLEWHNITNIWPRHIHDLYSDFCSFGHKNRKKCKEIATDYWQDYGVSITPMMFEIAFYESSKAQQGKGVE
jgi:predicted phage replisome organizer